MASRQHRGHLSWGAAVRAGNVRVRGDHRQHLRHHAAVHLRAFLLCDALHADERDAHTLALHAAVGAVVGGGLPPRWFAEIMRSIYLKGTTIIELGTAYVALAVIATLFNTFAALTYRKQS